MKFMHLSDLHIGKRVNDFSMLEDQQFILKEILKITDEVKPDAVLIAGDVYDKAVPAAEAVQLLDAFLTKLESRGLPVFLVSGNHDSAERIAFGSQILSESGIYIAPVFQGNVQKITLADEYGELDLFMLPFIKPAHVRRYFPEAEVESYDDAVRTVLNSLDVDESKRNVLIAHQFITGAERSDSEELSVGGLDNIDANAFDAFDYVALGHIHRPQKVMRDTIRYAGTPLKYSFSEADHKKSVTVVTMEEKGRIDIDTIPLMPRHDLRKIKGSYEELTRKANYENTDTQDYLQVTLTDEEDILDAIGKLRSIYPNIMKLEYDNARTRNQQTMDICEHVEEKTPPELVKEFYQLQNNQEMSEEQEGYLSELIEKIWEVR
ncbi:MAG: exonuclease SbcCD subunit D [Hespellia sp.]|nr:exonuclease SbcCD subunit D [Hespellia sp.]